MTLPQQPQSGANPAGNRRRPGCGRPKQAVYLVSVPETFRPQRPWDLPPVAWDLDLHAKNLPMPDALGFARAFNKARVQASQAGQPIGQWAIVAKHLRPRRSGKGGAR